MNWPQVKLASVSQITMGQSPPGETYNSEGNGLPFFQGKAEFGEKYPNTVKWCSAPSRIAEEGDILMSVRAPVGPVNISPCTCCIGRGLAAIRPNPSTLNLDYLWHFLGYLQPQLSNKGQGSTFAAINKNEVEQIQIPLPPLPEQKRIAAILDKADAIRRKRAQARELTDQFLQSVFLDMFGDPVTNPKGWEKKEFASLCTRVTVGIVVKPASYYVEHGVPALRSLNIKPGYISMNDLVYVSESDNEEKLSKTKLKAGDLVLVRTGQPGTAAIIPPNLDGVNAIDLLITSPNPDKIDPIFLCHFFNSAGGSQMVLANQRGQIQKHLNVGALNSAVITVPPLDLQREFANHVTVQSKQKVHHNNSSTEIEELFRALTQNAFKGDL